MMMNPYEQTTLGLKTPPLGLAWQRVWRLTTGHCAGTADSMADPHLNIKLSPPRLCSGAARRTSMLLHAHFASQHRTLATLASPCG